MSLLIWLPLHGNLTNYGSSPLTFSLITTGGGVAAATSGGKTDLSCYQRTTINTVARIESNTGLTLDKDFTMACWCYPTTPGAQTSANGVLTNHNHADCSGAGITLKYVSATDCRISCNTGNGTNRTYMDYYGTTNIYGAWHHLCLTYEKATQKYRLYVDGVCEKEVTYGNSAKANKFNLFDWSTGHSTNASYRPLCRLNDVRVYDNCLSKREVKLLSQGLVAHYKLSSEGANNLLKNTLTFTGTGGSGTLGVGPFDSVSKGYNGVAETTSYKEICSWNGVISPKPNEVYTASFYARSLQSKTLTVYLYNNSTGIQVSNIKSSQGHNKTGSDGNCALALTPEWQRYWITWTFNTNTTTLAKTLLFRVLAGNSAEIALVKLEKGSKATAYSPHADEIGLSIATDCSGYNRNGTTSGTFLFDTDSPRHQTCAIFDGTTTRVNLPIKSLMQAVLKDKCTINFWVNEADTANRSVYFGGYSGSNFNIEMQSTKFRVYWNANPDFFTADNSVTANTWAMFTVVTDIATGIKVYKNGALLSKKDGALTDITSGFTNATFRIGSDTRTDTTMMEGKMSDFRIYCSALSATDIEELYKNAASVTKDGRLIVYDIQESLGTNARLQKNGVFSAEGFSENGPLENMKFQVLSDGSAWARVFYHNNVGGTVFFTSVAEAKSCNTLNKYSCLHLLDSFKNKDGKYEFMLTFPTEFPGKYNRWKQNNNPCKEYVTTTAEGTGVAAGYSATSITWTGNYWGGLTRQNSTETTKSACYLSGSVGHSNWFYAIGAFEVWSGKMPGPNSTAVSDVELWVRIDNIPNNTQFSILKE